MNGMTSPFDAKKEETRKLLSYLTGMGVFVPLGIIETDTHIEVAFRVSKELASWQSFMKNATSVPKVFINKKFMTNDDKLVFCWSIQVPLANANEALDKIVGSKIKETPKPVIKETKKPDPKKRLFVKPIVSRLPNGDIKEEWIVNLPHVKGETNKPKMLEDGRMSSKGAFLYGGKEWSRTVSYQRGRR